MEHENEIIHWFCRLKSSSFSSPFSFFTLSALTLSFWVKKLNLTELNQRFTQSGARLTWSRGGPWAVICRTLDIVIPNLPCPTDFSHPLCVHCFPRTHSYASYSCFWPQLTSVKCCNNTTEGRGVIRRWTHTHTHTHNSLDSVQLFDWLNPDVFPSFLHLWCISVMQ